MNASGRDEEDITVMHLMARQRFYNGAILHTTFIIIWSQGLSQSRQQRGSWVGMHDIPHLGLTQFAVTSTGKSIIRVHLNTQVVGGIYELDKQGELNSMPLKDTLSNKLRAIFLHETSQRTPRQGSILDHGWAFLDITDFPTLTDGLAISGATLEGLQLGAAPHEFMKIIFKE